MSPAPRTFNLVIFTDTSQPHRRRRRSQPERRKSLFENLQSGGQLHLDLARGVLQIREERPGVAGWINSGMPRYKIRVAGYCQWVEKYHNITSMQSNYSA